MAVGICECCSKSLYMWLNAIFTPLHFIEQKFKQKKFKQTSVKHDISSLQYLPSENVTEKS